MELLQCDLINIYCYSGLLGSSWTLSIICYSKEYHLLLTGHDLRCVCSCSYTDIGCPVIEVTSFYRIQQSRCFLPSPEDGNRSGF
jgi:hypothetical protein